MAFEKYPKINSVFKRDQNNNFIEGSYSRDEFDLLKDVKWSATEKIDGTNIRIKWNAFDDELLFGGRTERADIPRPLLEKLESIFAKEKMRELFPHKDEGSPDVVLFGEGYGNKIQKVGKLYIPDGVDFILFDVKIGKWWLTRENVEDIATYLGIKHVPFAGNMSLSEAIHRCKDGFSSAFGDFQAEGYVMKLDLLDRSGNRIMTKIKYKDFN